MAYVMLPASSSESVVMQDAVDMFLGVDTNTFEMKDDRWFARDDVVNWARWAHVSSGAMINALESLAKGATAVSALRKKSKDVILASKLIQFVIERIEKAAIDWRANGKGTLLGFCTAMSTSLREARELELCIDQDLYEATTRAALEGAPYAAWLSSTLRETSVPQFRKLELALQGYEEAPNHCFLSTGLYARLVRVSQFLLPPSWDQEIEYAQLAHIWYNLNASPHDAFFITRTNSSPITHLPQSFSLQDNIFDGSLSDDLPGYLRPPPRSEMMSTLFTVELQHDHLRIPKPSFSSPLDIEDEISAVHIEKFSESQGIDNILLGPWPIQSKLLIRCVQKCLDAAELRALNIYQTHCDELRTLHVHVFSSSTMIHLDADNFFLAHESIRLAYEHAHELWAAVAAAKSSLDDWKIDKKCITRSDHQLDVHETAVARVIYLVAQSLERDAATALKQLNANLSAARNLDNALIAHRRYLQQAPGLAGLAFADRDFAYTQAQAYDHLIAALAHAVAFIDSRRIFDKKVSLAHYRAFHSQIVLLISYLDTLIDNLLDDTHQIDEIALFRELLAWDGTFFSPRRHRQVYAPSNLISRPR
uniref:Uncharacterized protein n=1 Tax=Aureoumbra lagunensis TaxID=44058 RepID=A0A7S3NN40_9STRA